MIETIDETGRVPKAERELLGRALARLAEELGAPDAEATVVFLNDDAIADRNLHDRGVEGTTDVLSYPSWEPEDDAAVPRIPHLGDVLIGAEVAARQAAEHGHDAATERAVLAAHGLMHLLGHDHPDEDGWAPFRTAQRRVVELRTEVAE